MDLSEKKYVHKDSRGGIRSELLVLNITANYFQS
jgi:hypothetical protein